MNQAQAATGTLHLEARILPKLAAPSTSRPESTFGLKGDSEAPSRDPTGNGLGRVRHELSTHREVIPSWDSEVDSGPEIPV